MTSKKKPLIVSAGVAGLVVVNTTEGTENTSSTTKVQTKDQIDRKTDPVIEKAKNSEKDTAPTIILSWIAPDGTRRNRTYTCAELRVNQDTVETFQKSGTKTTMNISIEAQVIERMP